MIPLIPLLLLLATSQASKPTANVATPQQRASTAEGRAALHLERIRQDPPALRAFLQAFPKGADLHTHLTGAVYAESYILWAAEMPLCIDLPASAFVEAQEAGATATSAARGGQPAVTCRDSNTQTPAVNALRDPALYRQLVDALSARHWHAARTAGHYQFFDAFQRFGAVAREGRRTSTRIVARSVAEVVTRASLQNVHHLELMMAFDAGAAGSDAGVSWETDEQLRASRDTLLSAGLRSRVEERRHWLDDVDREVQSILGCATPASAPACVTSIRYMPYALRGLPPAQVFAQAVFAFELAAADERIAGVNLVMPEDWFVPMRDHELHMRMYRFLGAQYPTVRVALHAGELWLGLVPPEKLGLHVRQAIEIGGARRIGHGTDVMHDANPADLMRHMARERIAVEISLSSSDLILGVRGARHPLRQYLRAKVPVVIATDDEGVARSDLTNEYQRAVEEHGVNYRELKEISRNSVEYSFLPAEDKARVKRHLETALAAFEASIRP